jgi:Flp pilus assembly protein TadB
MMTVVAISVAAGGLAALLAAPALRGLRPVPRRSVQRAGRPWRLRARHQPTDCAALLDAIARQVRSGSSLTGAVVDEVDPSTPLGDVVDRLTEGGSLVDALARVVPNSADLALTVQVLTAAAYLGGPVAATLDEAAAVVRERAAARAERRAHASQARISARVLTIVPLAFAVWSAVASRHTRDVYVTTVAGAICAACGLVLNVCGWQWMRRIIGPT